MLAPTHGLLLGQGADGTGWQAGEWAEMEPAMQRYFAEQVRNQWVRPVSRPDPVPAPIPVTNLSPLPHALAPAPAGGVAAAPAAGAGPSPSGGGAAGSAAGAGLGAAAAVVEFKGVTIQYSSHTVFNNLDWVVREGEKWVVLGGNGAGKSGCPPP